MNRRGAISLLLLIGFIIISLALAGGAFYLYQKEHAKSIQLQVQIDELTTRQRITESKLEESKKLAAGLQSKLQEAKTKIDSLNSELDQEKSARLEVSNKLEQQKADLEQQKSKREDLENKFNQSQDEGKKIKELLKVIEQQKADLELKIKNLEAGSSGVELGKVVVNNEIAAVDAQSKLNADQQKASVPVPGPGKVEKKAEVSQVKSLEGKVMVVNKEYNFVVLNLGVKDGIKIGDQFSVYHLDKMVGEVKVEKIHESMAAAGFAVELKDAISENDKVVQKVK